MRTMGRIPVVVATPTLFGGCDAREKTDAGGGVQAEKQQRYVGLIALGISNAEACRLVGPIAGRAPGGGMVVRSSLPPGWSCTIGGEDLRAEAAQPAVLVAAGTGRDRRPA